MTIGFVLMNVARLKGTEVSKMLRSIPEVVEHHPLLGEYDFIAKVESDELSNLGQIVTNKIRSIPGITHTETLAGMEFGAGFEKKEE